MSVNLRFNNRSHVTDILDIKNLRETVSEIWGVPIEDFYLTSNGKLVGDGVSANSQVSVVLKVFGGKGGFGSMLRAIGAQIEKTTNREACRDLSGRRLRDINEEKRLKNWLQAQNEREKEAEDKKQKKLERLCEKPKHEFKDEEYIKERASLPEKIEDAVTQGMKAACSSSVKRPSDAKDKKKKKKPKLWLDDDIELSSSEDESEESSSNPKTESENSNEASENKTEETKQEEKVEEVKKLLQCK